MPHAVCRAVGIVGRVGRRHGGQQCWWKLRSRSVFPCGSASKRWLASVLSGRVRPRTARRRPGSRGARPRCPPGPDGAQRRQLTSDLLTEASGGPHDELLQWTHRIGSSQKVGAAAPIAAAGFEGDVRDPGQENDFTGHVGLGDTGPRRNAAVTQRRAVDRGEEQRPATHSHRTSDAARAPQRTHRTRRAAAHGVRFSALANKTSTTFFNTPAFRSDRQTRWGHRRRRPAVLNA